MSIREVMERIWRERSCANPNYFNKWSTRFRDGHGNPVLGALKGKRAREKNPNKLGKLSWRPDPKLAHGWMDAQRKKR